MSVQCTGNQFLDHLSRFPPVSAKAARAYLNLPADDRFEARIPKLLKRDAEAVARSRGETLSQYVVDVLAQHVADDIVATEEWHLTPTEQATLLRVLAVSSPDTRALRSATKRADKLFGA